MEKITRRKLLEDSLLLLAASALPISMAGAEERRKPRAVGPNDKIRIAVIGFRGRGMDHVRSYAAMSDVTVAALCDPDEGAWGAAVKAVTDRGQSAPKTVKDLRRIMEDPEIDAVSIATPNHWHALAAIWAMQAGKDVYVEKPATHNVFEGRQLIEAARKYKRVCQVGTQSRSSIGLREAMAYLHAGKLGKISLARGLCYKTRNSIGKSSGPTLVPESVGEDGYNLWLGPAPIKPVMRQRFHYDWHWFWDYGNGDIGNQGVHEMDKALWGLNKRGLPKSAIALGGRFGYVDDGETPNTMVSLFDYGDCQLIFEVRGLKTDDLKGARVGNIYYGSEGTMVVPNYSKAIVYDNDGKVIQEFSGGGDHYRNFLDVCRSRKTADLNAPIEAGHYSAALCHLANISYRLGKPQPLNVKSQAFGDNKEAYETVARFEQHLADNGISLSEGTYQLGRTLQIDARREKIVRDEEANAMLTREYRAPFVVPTSV